MPNGCVRLRLNVLGVRSDRDLSFRCNGNLWTVSPNTITCSVCLFRSGLETAAFPGQEPAEIDRLLHMVVVGGGPTGVELR